MSEGRLAPDISALTSVKSTMDSPFLTSTDGTTTRQASSEGVTTRDGVDSSQTATSTHDKGISWIVCGLLIVGEMAGGGIVALPRSFADAGLIGGIILIIAAALTSGYTGIQLGDNWTMMQERWPIYRSVCRKPYPEMAYRSVGPVGRSCLTTIIAVQQFGLACVFLLLSSQNIANFIHVFFGYKINFCYIVCVVTVIFWPFFMLGTVKDFWRVVKIEDHKKIKDEISKRSKITCRQAAVIAFISTALAVIFIIVGTSLDAPACYTAVKYEDFSFIKFFQAYAVIMFAYGGHACFPTFQHDMKKPQDFWKSVIFGYIIVGVLYMPVAIYGATIYGSSLVSSVLFYLIIVSLQTRWTQQAVNVLVTIHVLFVLLIVTSPLILVVEELFKTPNKLSMRRFVVRSVLLLCILFVSLSVPRFGTILEVIGSTSITLMTMILPGVFSLYLTAIKRKRETEKPEMSLDGEEDNEIASIADVFRYNPSYVLALNGFIILFGLVGGLIGTVSNVKELFTSQFAVPCYVSIFLSNPTRNSSGGQAYCCGAHFNITSGGQDPAEFCAVRG